MLVLAVAFIGLFSACNTNAVKPNYEGVLQKNYGRNGKSDFKIVTGKQGWLWFGEDLYQVPMFEQKGDPKPIHVLTKDASQFTVDPSYTYRAMQGKGVDIIFNYRHVGIADAETIMDNVENAVLNIMITNAYREEARNFSTDSLMNNMNLYERNVEKRLTTEFEAKFFTLTPGSLTSGLTPPPSLADAINQRNRVKESVNTARNELDVAKMRLEKARIEKEENLVRASGLDAKVLQEQWIEAIRNTSNKVIITDGRTPIILGN